MDYKFIPHTADVKIHAEGPGIEEAFVSSAMALKEAILDFEKVKILEKIKRKIEVEGKDNESLLYNFLEEFLFLLDAEDFMLSKISKLEIDNGKLHAEILGDKWSKYDLGNKVKAVTYNEMFVRQEGNKWIVELVIDV